MPGETGTQQGAGAAGGAGAGAAGAAGAGGAGGAAAGGQAGAGAGAAGTAGGAAAVGAAGAAGGQGAAGGAGAAAVKSWWEAGGAGKPELKVPDGFEVGKTLSPDIEKIAIDHKLPSEAANAIFPLVQKGIEAHSKQVTDAWTKTQAGWVEALPKEHGDKFTQAKQDAAQFVQQFGDKELTDAFSKYGFGNFPALFRALSKAGSFVREKLSEDSSAVRDARPGAGGKGPQTREEKASDFYAEPKKNGAGARK